MGLSTALYNAVSGLTTISESLNVIGDNLANVNTVGYKASNAQFESVFSQTLTGATAPGGSTLGTNPVQVGLGVTLAAIDRDFTQGSLNATGSLSDLAIQGNGFFILRDGSNVFYTRDGSFATAVDGTFIDPATGLGVQGWQAVNGVVSTTGTVGNIVIPLGMAIVQETSNARITGNFNSAGDTATTGTVTAGPGMLDAVTGLTATGTSLLTNLQDSSGLGLGLAAGDTITITGRKGGADVTATYTVTAGSTVADLSAAIESGFGIVDGNVAVDPSGSFVITGDPGAGNAITDVILTAAGTGGARVDFNNLYNPGGNSAFTETAAADGESFVVSGLTVYDSLGNPVPLNMTFTRIADTDGNPLTNEVRYLAESPAGTTVGSGIITYDANGQFVNAVDDGGGAPVINIDRSGAGTFDPLDVTLDFSDTTFLGGSNTLALANQDGFPIGSLEEYSVGIDGVITGFFTNGLTQVVGQVALAVFPNQDGFFAVGDNLFMASANSGEAIVGTAGTGGRGTMVGGFLEGSNTDMATEFTNIIIAQRGFQANARTITAADRLLEEVISLVR
jgi:flagellar hook protein FlgE